MLKMIKVSSVLYCVNIVRQKKIDKNNARTEHLNYPDDSSSLNKYID